jgi:hypothetical protein
MSPLNMLGLCLAGAVVWLVLIVVVLFGWSALDDAGLRRPESPQCNVVELECD